jgi:hypothetical protein
LRGVGVGCGSDATRISGTFGTGDLPRLVTIPPGPASWAWPTESIAQAPLTHDRFVAAAKESESEIQRELGRAYMDAGFVEARERTWLDDDPTSTDSGVFLKKGSASVTLFETGTGALSALTASRRFARRLESATVGARVRDVRLPGLGDESWGVRVLLPPMPGELDDYVASVTYSWRRDNLVLEVHIACLQPCPSDPEPAARSWADAIDHEAEASG